MERESRTFRPEGNAIKLTLKFENRQPNFVKLDLGLEQSLIRKPSQNDQFYRMFFVSFGGEMEALCWIDEERPHLIRS